MRYAIKNKDGSIAIATLISGKVEDILQPDQSVIEDWDGSLPDRHFRSAYKAFGKKLIIDRSKAREQVLEEIREERNKRLEATDVEFQIEFSKNLDTASPAIKAIADKKQALRDLPAVHEAALASITDIEELKQYNIDTEVE